MTMPIYDEEVMDVEAFMKIPDEKKICFFVRTYPYADEGKLSYQDHDNAVS